MSAQHQPAPTAGGARTSARASARTSTATAQASARPSARASAHPAARACARTATAAARTTASAMVRGSAPGSVRASVHGSARTSAQAKVTPASPSAATASAQSAGAGRQGAGRPLLSVVRSAAPARATVPFLVLVALILAGALVASMVLNAGMADTAFKMHKAQIELNVVNDHIVTVRTELQKSSAPGTLAERASELGMVPAGAPGVVDLSLGTVSGGQPAQAHPQPANRRGEE